MVSDKSVSTLCLILEKYSQKPHFETSRPRQHDRHFADDTFKNIFLNVNVSIVIKNSLKFVPKGLTNKIPVMIQTMTWRRSRDKTSHYLKQWQWDYRHTYTPLGLSELTHWGRVTHICVSKLTIIGSDNGLSPGRRQAIIWTDAGILLVGPLGTNFSEISSIKILAFSFTKMRLKVSAGKWRPFCLGLNVLMFCFGKVDISFTQALQHRCTYASALDVI